MSLCWFCVSNTTAKCVGFSLFIISKSTFVNPKIADVSKPFEFTLGFFTNAKYAL